MAKVFQINRQNGFILNPDDKVVNGILKGLSRSGGTCPCYHGDDIPKEDLMCPCKEYRENKHCRCNLYVESTDTSQDTINKLYEEIEQNHNYIELLTKQNEYLNAKCVDTSITTNTSSGHLVY